MNLGKTLFILSSARGDSNTEKALRKFYPAATSTNTIDLRKCHIDHYDYDHSKNAKDDFLSIAERMRDADTIIFVTPVYWYAMSARMKVLFDRLSELLSTHKPIGKALKGRKVALVATGSDPELPAGFAVPFKMTADYFNMEYVGANYVAVENL